MKLFFPSSSELREPNEPPPPDILDQPLVYQVENSMDLPRRGGRLEYLVDWAGYGPAELSWVARDDILDPILLEDFHRTHTNCLHPEAVVAPAAT